MAERLAKKLLLIGWDAADWQVITPLLESGRMPNLQRLIDCGVMGNLTPTRPLLSPLLWNSVSTGKRADKHGVLGFFEPDPVSGELRPIASTARKVKAVWNILNQERLKPHVVGWYASHPAEPIDGVYVSELFPKAGLAPLGDWPMKAGTVHPPEIADTLAGLRLHPGEVDGNLVLPFIPRAAQIDQSKDKRLGVFVRLLAECVGIHAAATWILENREWDFMAVFYDAIDHFGHFFMEYHPPRLPQVPEGDFELYRDVMSNVYAFHDMMLGRLLELAGPDVTTILLSDHGFYSDHLRPQGLSRFHLENSAAWHRPVGIFCMAGPEIKQDELLHRAHILDVTPTILTLFGLPVGSDMEGQCLVEAFARPIAPASIPSWEQVPGDAGMHAPTAEDAGWGAAEVIAQLQALGYVDVKDKSLQKTLDLARMHQNFNLARVHEDAGSLADAAVLLEELVRDYPAETVFQLHLAHCRLYLGQPDECRRLVMQVLGRERERPVAHVLLGNLHLMEGNLEPALASFLEAEKCGRCWAGLRVLIGRIYASQKRFDEAERVCRDALEMDEDLAAAHLALAWVHLHRGHNADAAAAALTAVGLQHFLPEGHHVLGVALARLGRLPRAILALETCLGQQPGIKEPHAALAAIYEQGYHDPERAALHRQQAAAARPALFGKPLPLFSSQPLV